MSTRWSDHSEVTVDSRTVSRRTLTQYTARLSWRDRAGEHTSEVEGASLLGSAATAAILVKDATVSRIHAELTVRDGALWIRDLGSRNGTYVSGVRVESAMIVVGAVLRVGDVEIRVVDDGTSETPLWPEDHFGPLRGRTDVMRALFDRLSRSSANDSPVLVQGETGTGKELVARAIHDASPRAAGPFVVVDCAALPSTLIESELFGHARGAFTGADRARVGAIESADGGTVFLDEVGELPLLVQPKLLRAIESNTIRRLGETQHRAVNVRFISATHRDLKLMVNSGAFREDLFFRLCVLPVLVPRLRDRLDDVPLLIEHFAKGRLTLPLPLAALLDLAGRPWLGNVRELRNFVDRAVALGLKEALALDAQPAPSSPDVRASSTPAQPAIEYPQDFKDAREQAIDSFERAYLTAMLAAHGRNVADMARASGLDRTYIYRLLRKHDL